MDEKGLNPVKEEICPECKMRADECMCCPECGHVCVLSEDELYCPVCGPVKPKTEPAES